ncbi:TonB-dependent receptor [Sphingobium jiangsuense]|uniref:Iron complex outermembrane receptor protein n=1 Tax=Sphingobium jiangsuense TaxID=870476 RepID=A0A7W6BRB5_9SPHN|nr:TonB-dependent receptor [Sphingobium jiangsuense]MBB3928372.1 iron complex outermembrane receptor protein [Sphingobium jiangsuense]GLS99753.1 TonB-dependent receptor [Sphingobium jiangsuense]
MLNAHKTWLLLSSAAVLWPAAANAQGQSQSTPPRLDRSAPGASASPQNPADASEADAAQASNKAGLDDIVVTAQQRNENLQKAALAISVVTGEELLEDGIVGVDTLQKNVPALQVANASTGNFIFIRGVGSFSVSPTSDPAVAFNYDGVYVGRSGSTTGAFYDLERVELLKGPQGTLYGRNATAGAVNILPAQPRLGEFSGYGTASYGNYDAYSVEGAINVAAGDNAGLRFSGIYSQHDGYLRDGTSSDKTLGLRGQLKVELDPKLTIRIAADFAHQGGTGTAATYIGRFAFNPAAGAFAFTPSNLPVSEGLYTPAAQAYRQTGAAGTIAGRFNDPLAFRQYVDSDLYGVAAYIDYETSFGTISVIPAWRHSLRDILSANAGQQIGNTAEADQTSLEIRLVSPTGRTIDYILGGYYFSEDIDDDVHNTSGSQAAFQISKVRTRSPSVYGRLTFNATDTLRFTGGARYTSERKNFSSSSRTLQLLCTIPAASGGCPNVALLPYTTSFEGQPVRPAANLATLPIANGGSVRRIDTTATGRFNDSKITYRAAVEFDVAPRSLLYASLETGYRAGGFNPDASFGPEHITAYTIGSKNRFLDNRLQLNIEGFYWKYRDQQLSFLGINSVGAVGLLTSNIGRSVAKGVEVEALAQVTATTRLMANVQYLDSRYTSFTYVTPAPPYTGCATTPAASPTGAPFTVNCAGFPLFNAPKWTVNLAAQQRLVLSDDLALVLDADTQYRSGRYTNFTLTAQDYQGSTWVSNAQASLVVDDGRWSVTAFVRNIENNRYQTFATQVPGSNLYVSINAQPRTYGARLSTRF